MLVIAIAAVDCILFVGGLKPNIPTMFAAPINIAILISHGIYFLPFPHRILSKNPISLSIQISRISWRFDILPSTFRFRVSSIAARVKTAIIIQETTVASSTSTFIKGIVKTVSISS